MAENTVCGGLSKFTFYETIKEWSDQFLEHKINPYKQGEISSQQMFLGLSTSPDKLVTVVQYKDQKTNVINVYETKQEYVLACKPTNTADLKNSKQALQMVEIELLPLLSEKARSVVKKVIDTSLDNKSVVDLPVDSSILLLSHSPKSIGAIRNWQDRVDLLWWNDTLYVFFYKAYTYGSSPTIRPGLDWFSDELRGKLGIKR